VSKFSITMLGAIMLAVLAAILDDRADDFVKYSLIILASVLLGAMIAMEARHQHLVRREKPHLPEDSQD
jgi:disulfide bond formation protein DsbB